MDAVKVSLTILLTTLSLGRLPGSDSYLRRLGPPVIRFAPFPPSKPYQWPVGLNPVPAGTNRSAIVTDSNPVTSTNLVLTSVSPVPATNAPVVYSDQNPTAAMPLFPQIAGGLEGNGLSASNLLVLTPQMLADYFKATLDGLNRPATNASPGLDIPFNPPTPKPPSSEAVYRNQ